MGCLVRFGTILYWPVYQEEFSIEMYLLATNFTQKSWMARSRTIYFRTKLTRPLGGDNLSRCQLHALASVGIFPRLFRFFLTQDLPNLLIKTSSPDASSDFNK
jgi:hypothetical protein